jgi:phosphonate transport system permease protein
MVWLLLLFLAIAWSLAQANIVGRNLVNPGGYTLLLRFLQASIRPDLSQEFLLLTLNAALITLEYAVCGVALSTLLGLIGGLLMSRVRRREGKSLCPLADYTWPFCHPTCYP